MGKDEKKNELIAKATNTQITIPNEFRKKDPNARGVVDARDIVLPRYLIMQGLSKMVSEGLAKPGDVVDSLTGEVVVAPKLGVKFVPIAMHKTVLRYLVKPGQPPEYIGKETWELKKHRDLKWEEQVGTDMFKNMECLNFFIMLLSELESGSGLPGILAFRSASYKYGKKLVSHFARADMLGVEPWFGTLELLTQTEQGPKGLFWIPDIRPAGMTDPKFTSTLLAWRETISTTAVKIDEDEDEKQLTPEKDAVVAAHQAQGDLF